MNTETKSNFTDNQPMVTYENLNIGAGKKLSIYREPENSAKRSNDNHDFSYGKGTSGVSWKRSYECPNGGSEVMKFRHWSPRHSEISIDAAEMYETDAGKLVEKRVMLSMPIEAAEALGKMLLKCAADHREHGQD